ncbi:competence/damage-inducible protein A [Oceanobacillus kapialis]|uniref:Putative competence-damage inducible protein n=1 Tax=Oceanobacillus kapialis TaxID=481353 RepID=A0ABW5PZ69_9BACI
MKQLKTEIIAVGTELLLGQIANTNAQWLSQQLASVGINVYHHLVVGDNLQRVETVFRQAHTRSDVVIVTGGLGPTDDDLTREAFQAMSSMDIEEHSPSMEKITAFFEKRGSTMTPNNRKQARVFRGATVLNNKTGMAPGMIVSFEGRTWVFLPGVPREMKNLASESVFPYLQGLLGEKQIIKSMVLKFVGIGESQLEHELYDLIQKQDNPTIAPLAQDSGVVIRLTARHSSEIEADKLLDVTKQKVEERLSSYMLGINEQTIEQQIMELLQSTGKNVSAAESLTGGMFADKLVSIPGASDTFKGSIVCYATNVKRDVLGVSQEVMKKNGTVSQACAEQMAEKVSNLLDSSYGISFTGVAGPRVVENQQPGTVFVSIYDRENNRHETREYHLLGDRDTVRHRATLKGLEFLYLYIKSTVE